MSNLLRNCRTAGATLLRAGHIGRAEHGKHAGHAGFPLPKQAGSISASGAAALPIQLQLASRAATSLISLTCSSFGTAEQSGVTLLHAGHIGRAERREHARHAGFSSPRQADSISASGAAALPVQPARLYCELDTTATRSSCRSPSHVSRVHSRTTGIQDHTTSLRHSLPRGRADKGSLTSSALDDCIGVMSD